MIAPIWHDGPLEALAWDGRAPVAWRVAHGTGDAQARRAARRRFAGALVERLAGEGADGVRFGRDSWGAPLVAWPPGWFVSFASRGAESLIGVARRPLAVDRETPDDAPPLWDMLTETEAADLRRLPPSDRPRAWLRRWTIKEAHAKLIGQPRRIVPERVETRLQDAERAEALFEGRSLCWTRESDDAIETLALWDEASFVRLGTPSG